MEKQLRTRNLNHLHVKMASRAINQLNSIHAAASLGYVRIEQL